MPITVEAIKTLPDDELDRFITDAVEEKRVRTERDKQATIAKIRQMAAVVGVRVAIGGARGRPAKVRAHGSGKKPEAANGNATPVKKTG
jgi:hypothetical protein